MKHLPPPVKDLSGYAVDRWGWMGAGNFKPSSSGYLGGGTLYKYALSSDLSYLDHSIKSIRWIRTGSSGPEYDHTTIDHYSNPNADANRARFFGA